MKTNGIVVMNLHGILIDEQWEIYKRLQRNWSTYCGYLRFPKFITHNEFIQRKQYDMCNWLMLDKYKSKAAYIYGIFRTQSAILRNILEADDFYNNAELLNFATKCLMRPAFIESAKIKRVIILIDKFSPKQEANARKFCETVFNHPKISFLTVEPDKKWELVATSLKSFTLYMDHSIANIRRISEKIPHLETAEFIIPRYSFNQMPVEVSMLIHGKSGSFTYYEEGENPVRKNI